MGECELHDGKLAGIAVVVGARIGALAGASQVLVSQTVKDLVAGSGLAFDDQGEYELEGVPDRWRLFTVIDPSPEREEQRTAPGHVAGGLVTERHAERARSSAPGCGRYLLLPLPGGLEERFPPPVVVVVVVVPLAAFPFALPFPVVFVVPVPVAWELPLVVPLALAPAPEEFPWALALPLVWVAPWPLVAPLPLLPWVALLPLLPWVAPLPLLPVALLPLLPAPA